MAVIIFGAALTSCTENDDNPRKFIVSFDSNGGSEVPPQTIREGEKAAKPEIDPTLNGHTFVVWYKEMELSTEWKFDTDVVIADITLYAEWIENDDIIGNVKLLDTMTNGMGGYGKYEYDQQNRIMKYLYYIPNKYGAITLVHTLTFIYQSGDLVQVMSEQAISENVFQRGYYDFEKSGNHINIRTSSGENDEYAFSSSLELNSDRLPVKYNENLSIDGNPYRTITYQFQNGNLVETVVKGKLNNDGLFTSSTIFTYDDKKSPFFHCKTAKWFLFWYLREMCSTNNVIETTSSTSRFKSDVASDWENSTSKYEYVYDKDGFPTKCIMDGTKVTEYKYNN
jgi:hypothetical protein